jgi:hypothetical protein
MADEIALANVIRLEKHGLVWRALIGPDPASGLFAFGYTRLHALVNLDARCELLGWVFDDTYREPTLGDGPADAFDFTFTETSPPAAEAAPTAPGGANDPCPTNCRPRSTG